MESEQAVDLDTPQETLCPADQGCAEVLGGGSGDPAVGGALSRRTHSACSLHSRTLAAAPGCAPQWPRARRSLLWRSPCCPAGFIMFVEAPKAHRAAERPLRLPPPPPPPWLPPLPAAAALLIQLSTDSAAAHCCSLLRLTSTVTRTMLSADGTSSIRTPSSARLHRRACIGAAASTPSPPAFPFCSLRLLRIARYPCLTGAAGLD